MFIPYHSSANIRSYEPLQRTKSLCTPAHKKPSIKFYGLNMCCLESFAPHHILKHEENILKDISRLSYLKTRKNLSHCLCLMGGGELVVPKPHFCVISHFLNIKTLLGTPLWKKNSILRDRVEGCRV